MSIFGMEAEVREIQLRTGDIVVTASRDAWRWISNTDLTSEVARLNFAMSDAWSNVDNPNEFVEALLESILEIVKKRAFSAGDRHGSALVAVSIVT